MRPTEPVRITLRLPPDIAQDVIVRHAMSAREWRHMPFDPFEPPVMIEPLSHEDDSTELSARLMPWIIEAILDVLADHRWNKGYDPSMSLSVAGTVCAFALESGLRLDGSEFTSQSYRITRMPPLRQWLN